jgi:NAD(P)-dependent dehydrogenase (short-subunit alcohol dehydrogenase family)
MRVALVTGGSRGIGAATCRLLAVQGYAVAVNYLQDAKAASSVVAEIEAAGGHSYAVQADVANEASIVEMFAAVDRELGPLSALVNSAGILEQQMAVADMSAERINRVLQTNVTGSFICCREAIKRMSTVSGGAGGAVVNVSSMAAQLGSPNEYVDYAASKAAVDTLTRGLALEVAEQGIRVNAVRPGLIYTDMHASGGEPGRVDRLKDSVPMKRGGSAEEVAEAIVWLLSDKASFTTGSFIDVSGGR